MLIMDPKINDKINLVKLLLSKTFIKIIIFLFSIIAYLFLSQLLYFQKYEKSKYMTSIIRHINYNKHFL
jgi:cell division protein FtsI/penicillin-binding protein 2